MNVFRPGALPKSTRARLLAVAGLAAAVVASTNVFAAGEITGAGSTWVYPLVAKWADAYKTQTGSRSTINRSARAAASRRSRRGPWPSAPATSRSRPRCCGKSTSSSSRPRSRGEDAGLQHLRASGRPAQVLSGPLVADIFMGKITKWNDPAIPRLNPGVKLPDTAISVVHRSDGSGTTYTFADYLSKVSPEWKTKLGADTRSSGRSASAARATRAWPAMCSGSGRDRLRRVRVHPREQHELRADDQQRRQGS